MAADSILHDLSNERSRLIREFITNFLGHEPTREEKKQFVCMHSLSETMIYHKGKLLGTLEYNIFDPYIV
jgi:hypothetical protein